MWRKLLHLQYFWHSTHLKWFEVNVTAVAKLLFNVKYCFSTERELITPPLDGLILPGITRQSIIELSLQWNEFKVVERKITMSEVTKLLNENRVSSLSDVCVLLIIRSVKKIERSWKNPLQLPLNHTSPLPEMNLCLNYCNHAYWRGSGKIY